MKCIGLVLSGCIALSTAFALQGTDPRVKELLLDKDTISVQKNWQHWALAITRMIMQWCLIIIIKPNRQARPIQRWLQSKQNTPKEGLFLLLPVTLSSRLQMQRRNKNKTVSLRDLKGKVVILDFWATWCGPCKKSFPAIQLAVNAYKNDPNVQFLFIHTWERGSDDPSVAAQKYITDNKYSFQVLVDKKDPQTGINKVVTDYKITGIPTKFVIDANGNVRFRLTGFSGGDDMAVMELGSMIDLAKKVH